MTVVPENRRNATRYIQINETTMRLHIKGKLERSFEFQFSFGSFGMSSMVFGDPWAALGAFGQPLGLHLSPLKSIGAPLRRHCAAICAPFVAFEAPLERLWVPVGVNFDSLGIHWHAFETH